MMWAIWREVASMVPMADTASRTTTRDPSADTRAARTMTAVSRAVARDRFTVAVIWSWAAAVSSSMAA